MDWWMCGSAVPAGAELLLKEGHENIRTEAATLPAQVYPQPDRLMSAGWSLLPHLLQHSCFSAENGKV